MLSNQLSGAKRALLEKRLGRTFSDVGVTGRIPRRPLKERAPLSIQQHRQWLLLEKEERPSFYHFVVQLAGSLDATAFCRAFDEVVNRHEIRALRSSRRTDNLCKPFIRRGNRTWILKTCQDSQRMNVNNMLPKYQ